MAWVTKSSEEHYDAPQEPQRVYTRSEKAKNWWHYYKWVVLVVALLIVCGAWLVHDILSNQEADYQVGWVAGYSLPDETAAALQTALAQYGEDRNGDGQVTVQINQYVLDLSDSGDSQTTDAYNRMAGMTRLSADLADGANYVYILEDPASFQATAGALQYLDGTMPQEGASDWENMVYLWADCPVLAGQDLGGYTPLGATAETSASSQELLASVYVGCCGTWNDAQAEKFAGCEAFWQALTEGAKPAAGSAQ